MQLIVNTSVPNGNSNILTPYIARMNVYYVHVVTKVTNKNGMTESLIKLINNIYIGKIPIMVRALCSNQIPDICENIIMNVFMISVAIYY